MASREGGSVGVLVLMLFCIGSAHRLFPSEAPSNHIQPSPGSKYKSTPGLFQFEMSASELLGRIPLAQEPTNGPWDSDCPAEKEKQDGEPCLATRLTKYGAASPKAVRAELTKGPVGDYTNFPSHANYGIGPYEPAPPPDEAHAIIEATPPDEVHSIQHSPELHRP